MQPSVMIHKYLTAECCDWPIKIQYFRMSCNKNCISHWSAQNWEAFNVFFLRKCVISVMRRRPEDLDEASVTFRSFWGDLVRRKESKHYLKGDISYTFPWNIASYTHLCPLMSTHCTSLKLLTPETKLRSSWLFPSNCFCYCAFKTFICKWLTNFCVQV